ncbi:MAG: ArsR/SmtB family transcription factor [Candidatus Dormibacteria bacterium]
MGRLQTFKAEYFKALAHPTRIRILELLADGEKSVGELQVGLGPDGAAASQQLAILRMRNIVDTRRAGTSIFYRLHDPEVVQVLDTVRRIFDTHVGELRSIADEAPPETKAGGAGRRRRLPAA